MSGRMWRKCGKRAARDEGEKCQQNVEKMRRERGREMRGRNVRENVEKMRRERDEGERQGRVGGSVDGSAYSGSGVELNR